MSYIFETGNINTTTSLNKIPIQGGTPISGQSLIYNSISNQWVFSGVLDSGSTGPTGPTRVGSPYRMFNMFYLQYYILY